jgi:hypothetical protein
MVGIGLAEAKIAPRATARVIADCILTTKESRKSGNWRKA